MAVHHGLSGPRPIAPGRLRATLATDAASVACACQGSRFTTSLEPVFVLVDVNVPRAPT
jgi:hypothetical protein